MTMAVSVAVRSYTHATTYVADNILKSLKNILLYSGLDPDKLVDDWNVLHLGIKTWIDSGHLEKITLEVFDQPSGNLIGRWDVNVSYEWTCGDGQFWTDTDAIRFAIKKAGVFPSSAKYRVVATTAAGRSDVPGWSTTTHRSTEGMVEQRIGTSIEASGLSGTMSYYRRR
jgi:hypothetical protein